MTPPTSQGELRGKLLEIITYHGDEGTSGYALSNEQIEQVMELFESQLTSLEEGLRGLLSKTDEGWMELHDLVEAEEGYLQGVRDAIDLIKSRREGR